MKHSISALALGASMVTLVGTGCSVEVSADKYWEGDTYEDAVAYQVDGNITVEGNNGDITIMEGDTKEIGILMEPAVARPGDTCDGKPKTDSGYCEGIDNDLSKFEPNVMEDSDGNWLIEANLDGGRPSLKADITVWLPTTFNGVLDVNQGNGDVQVDGVQDAWKIDVNNSGAGGITIDDAGPAEEVLAENNAGDCNLDVGSASHIDIFCDTSDLTVNIDGIPDGTENRHIESGLGDLVVNFPNTDQAYTVQAQSAGKAITVNSSNSCQEVDGSTDTALTMACNDGADGDPNYVVETADDLTAITLNF